MISPTPSLRTPIKFRRSHRLGALTLVAASVVLSGCSPAPSPTPTPTAAFASEEEAFAAAEETYRAYTAAFNEVNLSAPESFEPVFELSSGDFEAADRRTLSKLHAENYSFTGQIALVSFEGLSSGPRFEQVVAEVCVDVSNSDVVDQSGNSVADPTRPDINPLRVTFVASAGRLLIDRADRDVAVACAG